MPTLSQRLANETAMVRRIVRVYRSASLAQQAEGYRWYDDAHDIALHAAAQHALSLETSAAVIAALSPLMPWGQNVKLARRAMRDRELRGGALSANVDKVNRLLAGEHAADVLGHADAKSGHKVRAFYRCILTGGRDPYAVCVDRHATAIAIGTREQVALTDKRYRSIASAYRRATEILNRERGVNRPPLTPAQVQATTWVAWRARWWDGARLASFDDIDDRDMPGAYNPDTDGAE